MKAGSLVLVLGLPLAAGCGLILGVEERAVSTLPDAALQADGDTTGDAAATMDGTLGDSALADAPLEAQADADAAVPTLDPKSLAGLELCFDGRRRRDRHDRLGRLRSGDARARVVRGRAHASPWPAASRAGKSDEPLLDTSARAIVRRTRVELSRRAGRPAVDLPGESGKSPPQ